MDTVLSILVLAILALPAGAAALWRRGARRQAVLMLVLAAGNLAIWTLPDSRGQAPLTEPLRAR